ncbi:MAG TPA: hypothetical protein VFS67_26160 [Polyangiaceae bacterium]|nr:hypothetical protein [Polyangiaceae bacterium]
MGEPAATPAPAEMANPAAPSAEPANTATPAPSPAEGQQVSDLSMPPAAGSSGSSEMTPPEPAPEMNTGEQEPGTEPVAQGPLPAVPSAGCGRTRTLQDGTHTITSGGMDRTYFY